MKVNNDIVVSTLSIVYKYLISNYALVPFFTNYLSEPCIKIKFNSSFIIIHLFINYEDVVVLAVNYGCSSFNFQFIDILSNYDILIDKAFNYLGIYKGRQFNIFSFI